MNEIKLLFSQLCKELKMLNANELKSTKGLKCLKMDYNSIYGGYRIDIVHESTGESFFSSGSRYNKREMVAHLRGLLKGLEY